MSPTQSFAVRAADQPSRRAHATTLSGEPSKPSCTRSACIRLAVGRSLRDLHCSVSNQPVSFPANGSSLLGRVDILKSDSTISARGYFLMVSRDSPVPREIPGIGILSLRRCLHLGNSHLRWVLIQDRKAEPILYQNPGRTRSGRAQNHLFRARLVVVSVPSLTTDFSLARS